MRDVFRKRSLLINMSNGPSEYAEGIPSYADLYAYLAHGAVHLLGLTGTVTSEGPRFRNLCKSMAL